MNIPCSIVLDLLPAYVDGLCSEESEVLVEEHFSKCEKCQNAYKNLKEPLAVDGIEKKDNLDSAKPLKKLKGTYIVRAIMAAFLAMIIGLAPFIADQIEPIRNMFHPSQSAIIYVEEENRSWERLPLEKGCLVFDSPFYEKKVINHANSHDSITVRIKNQDGQIIVPAFSLNPGEAKALALNADQPYYVEVKADQGSYIVVFI